ncbi:hypothetical protein G7Y79_00031g065940 [Physcia stellaris]|nr:hypothetical protein G7Y79_00031g065940 [Physcia stellaris]
MAIAWKYIPIVLYAALSVTAISPRASLDPMHSKSMTLAQSNETIHPASNTVLKSVTFATRELVRHQDLLLIRYLTHERLPSPLYRHVIEWSLEFFEEGLRTEGDEALLPHRDRYSHIEDNVLLMVDHARHSSSDDLTYGIICEAIEVVKLFMQSRPFHLEAEIWGGLDGSGFPLGYIEVRRGPRDPGRRGNLTTE